MPHLVEMHKKFARDGLVALSVSVDDEAQKPATQQAVLKVLQKRKVTCTNVLLDEDVEFWQKKLHFESLPCVFVFNRQGKWTQFKDETLDYDKVDELAVELLKQP